MKQENKTYNWIIDLLGIPKYESKDEKKIKIIVFRIEINISIFIAKLLVEKLDKAITVIAKIFAEKSISFFEI